jgi:hypothetical protein
MEAMMGRLKDEKMQNLFIVDQTGKTETFEVPESSDGEINLKQVPIVYIKNCKDGDYTFNRRTTKIFIENCQNCKVTVNQSVLTNTIEAWKGGQLTLCVNTECKTIQLDILDGVTVSFAKKDCLGAVVWNQLKDFTVDFGDAKELTLKTGEAEVKKQFEDSNEVDQYVIRFLNGQLTQERCIRLKNGHLSTEREAIEWDKRNTMAKEKYMQAFLKEAGIHLNKSEKVKTKPNEKCPCGSGKKFKKCCMNKKVAEGTSGLTYKK